MPSAYARWRNQQVYRSDVVPGWLPILIPYTYQYFALQGQLSATHQASDACGHKLNAVCACEGLSRAAAQGSFLQQGVWGLASPLCASIQQNYIDAFFTVVCTWPMVAAMVFLRKWYVTWRTQLVAALRLCVMSLPALLTYGYNMAQLQHNLEVRGTWGDSPGSPLANCAGWLGLAEYQLKQLLALLTISFTGYALLLPPAWEAPVSFVVTLTFVTTLARVSQALGQFSWAWTAALAVAGWVLCSLLPILISWRRERRFQAQYQQHLAATEQQGMLAMAGSSSQAATTKAAAPAPDGHTTREAGPSRSGDPIPGSSRDVTARPPGEDSTAAAASDTVPDIGLWKELAAGGLTVAAGLYTTAGPCQQLALSVGVEFAAAGAHPATQYETGERAAAVMHAAHEALGLVCEVATDSLASTTAAGTSLVQQPQGGGGAPVGVTSSVYVARGGVRDSPHGTAGSSLAEPAQGLLVQLLSMEAADSVQLVLVTPQLDSDAQHSNTTADLLEQWWGAVQLLVASVPGVTRVTGGAISCITPAADAGGLGAPFPDAGWPPGRSSTGGLAIVSAGPMGGLGPQGPVGASRLDPVDNPTGTGGASSTQGGASNSRLGPPSGGSRLQGSGIGSGAMQWAFQLHWHAPFCLSDQGLEAAEAPELLLQLSLQPAPGSSVGGNPYTSVDGNRAFLSAAVAAGSSAAMPADTPAAATSTAEVITASAAAAAVASAAGRQQAQTPAHLRGCLGDLVTFLVTDEVVTTSWSWPEEEVLRLVQAQQLQQQQQQAQHPAPGAFSVAVRLQLPWHLSSRGVHELLLAHRLPPPSGSSDDSAEGPLQALALVPLCVLPPAAYLEVDQHLLPSMWAEAHSVVMRRADAAAGGQGSGNSSSLQDYALAFTGSSSSSNIGIVPPEVAAAEALTWRHWCQLAGDISMAGSLSRVLTGQAFQQQATALLLCQQELQGVVGRLLGYFLGHRLVACCEAVLQQLPPHLQPGCRAAVQQHLAAVGTGGLPRWQEQVEAGGQQQQQHPAQGVECVPSDAAEHVRQQGGNSVAAHVETHAFADAAVQDQPAAADVGRLAADMSGVCLGSPTPVGAEASSKTNDPTASMAPSVVDSAAESSSGAGSSGSGAGSRAYSRCNSAGSASRETI